MASEFEESFFDQLDGSQLSWIFEGIPDIYFFAKDLEGRFTLCNSASLKAFGLSRKEELIGKNDYDIASEEIASQYREADRQVILSQKPIRNHIEPVPSKSGIIKWYSTSKVPLYDKTKKVVGVAVIMRDLSGFGALLEPYQEMTEVVNYIFQNYHRQITVETLAELANISLRQLERRFKKLFSYTPLRYINEHRIHVACQKLRKTNVNIADIAKAVGFYDHAHFIRNFKVSKDMTPNQYRDKYRGCH
ncbi:MAG: AraC family transcriptional regulator [Lentisphaeraceae bacterium]|nr:AraC family transcriptional regulator [Lentisphaeraceae bacterium]